MASQSLEHQVEQTLGGMVNPKLRSRTKPPTDQIQTKADSPVIITDNAKSIIKEFVMIDEEMIVLSKQLRDLRSKRKELEKDLISIMSKLPECDFVLPENKGALVYDVKPVKNTVSQKYVKDILIKELGEDKGDKMYSKIYVDNRTTTDKQQVKRKSPKSEKIYKVEVVNPQVAGTPSSVDLNPSQFEVLQRLLRKDGASLPIKPFHG